MQIEIRAIGRIREEYIAAGVDEYRKRLQQYARLSIHEFPEGHIQNEHSPSLCQQVREREGTLLLKGIPESMWIIALDPDGGNWSSTDLAHRMASWELSGKSGVVFLIGGPLGLHETIYARSDHRLSLSRMTFPHQLVRLILVEQIYRAFRIMRGEPYHK
jgi:23S rRNA (pseudouridine1915-N3)-methyltransferase